MKQYEISGSFYGWLDWWMKSEVRLEAINPEAGLSIDYSKVFKEAQEKEDCEMATVSFVMKVEADTEEQAKAKVEEMLKGHKWSIISQMAGLSGLIEGMIKYSNVYIGNVKEVR